MKYFNPSHTHKSKWQWLYEDSHKEPKCHCATHATANAGAFASGTQNECEGSVRIV